MGRRRTSRIGAGRRSATLLLALLAWLAIQPPQSRSAALEPVLRVGITDGSQPCSYRVAGAWAGLAVDLWSRVAREERLPYVMEPKKDLPSLLEAVRRGEVDVAVGCLNVSPERLRQLRFTLPFQEGGLAVLVRRSRLDVGRAMLLALLHPDLLRLLGGYLVAIGLVAVALWRIEGHGTTAQTIQDGRRRSFARVFQILATGPGTNTIAVTTRGHGLVVLGYVIRIVSASLLVSAVTLNVVRDPQDLASRGIRSVKDLAGLRVAARPGSVSADLLRTLSATPGLRPVEIVTLVRVEDAEALLAEDRADAVLADELQLRFLLRGLDPARYDLALSGIRTESQAFALAPQLPASIAERLDRQLSALKRSGVVAELRAEQLRGEGVRDDAAAEGPDPRPQALGPGR